MQNNTFSSLFVGQNIVVLQRVDSTNNYLKLKLSKSTPLPEGTVIMAEEQYAGRGQAKNLWCSESGKNLTFSVLLQPVFIHPEDQFKLNIAVSIAINDVLQQIVGSQLKIKWPNDIYFKDKKIGGVLIENSIRGHVWKHAIVGIGINVNQIDFPAELDNVSSIKQILHQDYDLNTLLRQLCQQIESRYLALKQNTDMFLTEYLNVLYRINEEHTYIIHGIPTLGKIVGIDKSGCLLVLVNKKVQALGLKEISFVIR